MKRSNYLLTFILMFLSLSIVFSTRVVLGQESNNDKQVKIKIIKKENGETEVIDKTFNAKDKEELEKILEEFDIEYDLDGVENDEEVEIIIKKRIDGEIDKDVAIDIDRFEDEHVQVNSKAFLGVFFEQLTEDEATQKGLPNNHGVVITEVIEGSAAEKAGIKENDFITKVGDTEVSNSIEFVEAIASNSPNEEVEIVYYRDGKKATSNATLGERTFNEGFNCHQMMHPQFHGNMQEFEKQPFLGVTMNPSDESSSGIKVEEVIEGTTAEAAGLKNGDVIQKINGQPVNNLLELRNELKQIELGENVQIEYEREGTAKTGTAPIKSKAECHALKFGPENMKHCFKYKMLNDKAGLDKEQIRENLEKRIEILQRKLEMLDASEEGKENKEVDITISIEDISETEAADLNSTNKNLETTKNVLPIEDLSFSPNPNNGRFNLSFQLPEKGKTTIRIVDINNKEIYNETLSRFSGPFSKQIDISENSRGVYFLQVTQNNKAFNKKIIIQ